MNFSQIRNRHIAAVAFEILSLNNFKKSICPEIKFLKGEKRLIHTVHEMVLDGYKKMTMYADYENVNFLDKMHLNTVSQ